MQEEFVRKIAALMTQQTSAYTSLRSMMMQLTAALTLGEPTAIESLTRAGDSELFRMRARLLEITTMLSEFGRNRTNSVDAPALEASTRDDFEASAQALIDSAREFSSIARRAKALAVGGSSFAAVSIQFCGIPATTYRAPVLRNAHGAGK